MRLVFVLFLTLFVLSVQAESILSKEAFNEATQMDRKEKKEIDAIITDYKPPKNPSASSN